MWGKRRGLACLGETAEAWRRSDVGGNDEGWLAQLRRKWRVRLGFDQPISQLTCAIVNIYLTIKNDTIYLDVTPIT